MRDYKKDLEVCDEWEQDGIIDDVTDMTRYYIRKCVSLEAKNQELESQVAQLRDALVLSCCECEENYGCHKEDKDICEVFKALRTPAPARWEKMQKVVDAAKECMEAHKAWHGEDRRFNSMVALKDALKELEGCDDA